MQSTMLTGLARTQHDPSEVRCRCLVCGAHAYALPNVPLSGRCGNCHSLELEPLEPLHHGQEPLPRRRITGATAGAQAPQQNALAV
jgi:hypothetical protein